MIKQILKNITILTYLSVSINYTHQDWFFSSRSIRFRFFLRGWRGGSAGGHQKTQEQFVRVYLDARSISRQGEGVELRRGGVGRLRGPGASHRSIANRVQSTGPSSIALLLRRLVQGTWANKQITTEQVQKEREPRRTGWTVSNTRYTEEKFGGGWWGFLFVPATAATTTAAATLSAAAAATATATSITATLSKSGSSEPHVGERACCPSQKRDPLVVHHHRVGSHPHASS